MNGGPRNASFAQQRLIAFALLFGVGAYALVAAIVLQQNDGKGLQPDLPTELADVALLLGPAMLVAGLVLRVVMNRRAEALPADERAPLRFQALLLPLAVLEAGALFGITVWMLSGKAVPSLVIALVLFAAMIAIVPLRDPDEGTR
jgi:F0F1-type ATP synthase membrane subunit c/vacuolar-type H+-ATPase subunit K